MAFLVAGHHNCIPSFSIFYFDKSLELLEYLWPKEINKCYGVVGLVIWVSRAILSGTGKWIILVGKIKNLSGSGYGHFQRSLLPLQTPISEIGRSNVSCKEGPQVLYRWLCFHHIVIALLLLGVLGYKIRRPMLLCLQAGPLPHITTYFALIAELIPSAFLYSIWLTWIPNSLLHSFLLLLQSFPLLLCHFHSKFL